LFSTVDNVSSGFSGLIATSDAPAARDLRQHLLICLQFEIAVGTPAAAIEGHDDRTFLDQRTNVDGRALGVLQYDWRRLVANFQRSAGNSAGAQLIDMPLHDRLPFGRNPLVPADPGIRRVALSRTSLAPLSASK
jgi:hypothetical protein